MELHRNLKPWPPGVSGNPNRRPVGSRTVFSQGFLKLAQGFLKDLASVWAERGRAALEKTAIDQPGVFFCNLRQTDRPRGQADDRADASRQSEHGGVADDERDHRRRSSGHSRRQL